MKCIATDCRKSLKKSLQSFLITPFEDETDEMKRLFSYFLYHAPNIESAHSIKLCTTSHSDILKRMLEGRHFKYQKFCFFNAIIGDELKKGFIDGNNICLKCKRFVCKKKKHEKGKEMETDLECFLRHIRNAIAHGRVYCCHAGNRVHIVFEDENQSGNLSARIVCIQADLKHWKQVLSDPANYK